MDWTNNRLDWAAYTEEGLGLAEVPKDILFHEFFVASVTSNSCMAKDGLDVLNCLGV